MTMHDELLPPWADRLATDEYEIGSQLCTKDGRKVGNGIIVGFDILKYSLTELLVIAQVVTDAGNSFWATGGELRELFHEPKYVMKEEEVEKYRRKANA